MVDIRSTAAEIRRGKKEEEGKKLQGKNAKNGRHRTLGGNSVCYGRPV